MGNIDSEPSVRGTERSWINGSTILWPESNTNRYRRRYPSPRIGFFYRYYWCTRSSSGMSRFMMRGGALPFELFPGHQFPSCGGTDTCVKYTTRREQTRYEGPSAHWQSPVPGRLSADRVQRLASHRLRCQCPCMQAPPQAGYQLRHVRYGSARGTVPRYREAGAAPALRQSSHLIGQWGY